MCYYNIPLVEQCLWWQCSACVVTSNVAGVSSRSYLTLQRSPECLLFTHHTTLLISHPLTQPCFFFFLFFYSPHLSGSSRIPPFIKPEVRETVQHVSTLLLFSCWAEGNAVEQQYRSSSGCAMSQEKGQWMYSFSSLRLIKQFCSQRESLNLVLHFNWAFRLVYFLFQW